MRVLLQIRIGADGSLSIAADDEIRGDTYSGLEIGGDIETLLSLDISQVRCRLPSSAISHCVSLWISHDPPPGLAGGSREDRTRSIARIERLMNVASSIGADRISLVPAIVNARHPVAVSYQAALNDTATALEQLLIRAEFCGVKICLRAAQAGMFMSPPELREFIDRFASPWLGADIELFDRCDHASAQDWLTALETKVRIIRGHAPRVSVLQEWFERWESVGLTFSDVAYVLPGAAELDRR